MEPKTPTTSAPKKGKRGLIITILVIIIVVAVAIWWTKKGGSTGGSAMPTTLAAAPYANASSTFSIQFPEGWTVDDAGQFGALVFAVSPTVEEGEDSKFSTNINVTAEEIEVSSLDDYIDATLKALPQFLSNYETTDNKTVTVSGVPARIIGGKFSQGKLELQNLQLITLKEGKAYVVTATSLESVWGKYEDLLMASAMSFNIK